MPTIVLVHGFGSSRAQNWKSTGWYGGLTAAGFAIVAMDCRGHGDSGKPHDDAAYGHDRMAEDVVAVMEACALSSALILGYSMGGFIGLRLLAAHPERVIKLAIAGVGETYLAGPHHLARGARRAGRCAADAGSRTASPIRARRCFAPLPTSPARTAWRWRPACGPCRHICRSRLWRILQRPVLVVTGDKDDTAGRPEPLAAAFADGNAVTIAGAITCRRWATSIPARR